MDSYGFSSGFAWCSLLEPLLEKVVYFPLIEKPESAGGKSMFSLSSVKNMFF
jgi:hypothetical protein